MALARPNTGLPKLLSGACGREQRTTNNKHPSPLQNVAFTLAARPKAIFARYRKKKRFTSKGQEHD